MDMKHHILAAMLEQVERWESLLAGISEAQIVDPRSPSPWSLKDEIAHLWSWQQRSIARMEAARLDRPPVFPEWLPGVDPDEEGTTDRVNAWLFEANRDRPWPDVRRSWREGYAKFLQLAEGVEERDLLDSSRYAWMGNYALAWVLLASYDHHQEHLDKAESWLHPTTGG